MSIAHSRANVTWSRSSTSSLNACRPPSGMATRRTGRSRLDSHEAALNNSAMWSRLRWMSARVRMPRTLGIRPTAVYGSGIEPVWHRAGVLGARRAPGRAEIAVTPRRNARLTGREGPTHRVEAHDSPGGGRRRVLAWRPMDGFGLTFDDHPGGDEGAVVLLHGWPGDRHDYRAVVPLLAGRRVLVPDLRGFGDTTAPDDAGATAYGVD